MKYLLVVLVVVVGLWLLLGRGRRPPRDGAGARKTGQPDVMVSCEHCGVHLPRADALLGADGRPYCSEAHRLAGRR